MNEEKKVIDAILDDLDKLYIEFSDERKDRSSKQSYEYRDGKCDGIDIAIARIVKKYVR